jgi:hypothetical protein
MLAHPDYIQRHRHKDAKGWGAGLGLLGCIESTKGDGAPGIGPGPVPRFAQAVKAFTVIHAAIDRSGQKKVGTEVSLRKTRRCLRFLILGSHHPVRRQFWDSVPFLLHFVEKFGGDSGTWLGCGAPELRDGFPID